MNKIFLGVIIILVVVFLGVFALGDKENDIKVENGQSPSDKEMAEGVGKSFMEDFMAIAPPSEDLEAEVRILGKMSERALGEIDTETLSRDMALFVGVQDIPDQGVDFKEVNMENDVSAVLEVELKYSGSSAHRNIHLVKEGGEWKVDSISSGVSSERMVSDFSKTGNIVRDNPGYPEGVWFLIFEEPGSPAISKALYFNEDSVCMISEEEETCDPDEMEVGSRVEVEGFEKEDEIEVMTLWLLED